MSGPHRKPPENIGRALATQLKAARTAAGIGSQPALAERLGVSPTLVTKCETGARVPTEAVFTEWVKICDVQGQLLVAIEDLWWLARSRDDPVAAQAAPWFEVEAAAHTLQYWALDLVPGIAQTGDYARELFATWGHGEDKIPELVAERLGRQERIESPDGPDVTIVLWERVLDTPVGSPQTMHGQLARLVELYDRHDVSVHVLPLSTGANRGLGGAISLAITQAGESLLIEGSEDVATAEESRVRRASTTFVNVRKLALNGPDSRTKIQEAMERWSR